MWNADRYIVNWLMIRWSAKGISAGGIAAAWCVAVVSVSPLSQVLGSPATKLAQESHERHSPQKIGRHVASVTATSEAAYDGERTASKVIEEAKRREIVGEAVDDRRTKRFLELVVLPFGVCFLLVALLRRGLWS